MRKDQAAVFSGEQKRFTPLQKIVIDRCSRNALSFGKGGNLMSEIHKQLAWAWLIIAVGRITRAPLSASFVGDLLPSSLA
jgi:hypothetical protein